MIFLQQYGIMIVVALMIVVIIYLLYYVYTKDAYYKRNIRSIASVVEDLNKEIFYLKKKVSQEKYDTQASMQNRMSDEEIYQEIERGVYDMVQPISMALEHLEVSISTLDTQVDTRLASLESGVKQIAMPSAVHSNDDDKIIALYKQGIPLETISKELHLSQPEVEFVLKINKIK